MVDFLVLNYAYIFKKTPKVIGDNLVLVYFVTVTKN